MMGVYCISVTEQVSCMVILSWKNKTKPYITWEDCTHSMKSTLLMLSDTEKKMQFECWDLPWNKKAHNVFDLGWISMSPSRMKQSIVKCPTLVAVSLLWAGKWETECLSGSIAISASSSYCMIGIFSSGLRAPIIASFISWFKSHCASRSVYFWKQQHRSEKRDTNVSRVTRTSSLKP